MTDNAHTPNETSVDTLRRRARRRLLGAVVLALGAAIALPLVFEKEPPPLPDEVDIRVPPVDKTPFNPKPAMSKADAAVAAKPADATKIAVAPQTPVAPAATTAIASNEATTSAKAESPAVPAAEKEKTPAKVEQKAEPKADAKSDAKTDTKQTANADPDGPKNEPKAGDFAVQLVAVRDAANAQKVLNNLRELGYKSAYREKIDVTNGQVIRVRTGPYKEKATAERVHKELKEKGFDATIVAIK